MRKITLAVLLMLSFTAFSQTNTNSDPYQNAADKMASDEKKLTIGGYAQIDYNQPIAKGTLQNGTFDVHRLVLLFGYKFTEKIQFITEVEFEHVSEVYVEQAFVEYKVKDWLKFRGGLMLIPMGIINEYHEPTTYNGVERPSLDTWIVPTTWRDIGIGATGIIRQASIKYQLYAFNGLMSYNGSPTMNGKSAIRGARQKGMEAISLTPSFAGKVEYYGVKGMNIGLSGYKGLSQSTLFDDVPSEGEAREQADSSVVGLTMIGLDARYQFQGLMLRGQFNYGWFANTEEYDVFTGSDLGSSMTGFYLEAAYNVFASCDNIKSQLIPFFRYENYNTQNSVEGSLDLNKSYHRQEYTFGIGWKPISGVALKADYQIFTNKASDEPTSRFDLGIGVWF